MPDLRQVMQFLKSLEGAGIEQLPQARDVSSLDKPGKETPVQRSPSAAIPTSTSPSRSLPGMDETLDPNLSSASTLEILREEVAQCELCGELASTRTQTVFGVGNPRARLCLLGEAPGADEDRLGEPFVGRGGQLLNKILEACHLGREDVYILNVLKCRPPNNRNPLPEESQNCRRFLDRQLQLISPEFICCLGAVAAQNLLSTTTAIGRLRGKVHQYRGIHVVCTYHPAYLLRNPSAKKHTWDDIKLLMREMGTPVD